MRYKRWLRAYASYEDKSLEWGSWLLSGGAHEGFKERFEVAATRADMALRPGLTGKPFEVSVRPWPVSQEMSGFIMFSWIY